MNRILKNHTVRFFVCLCIGLLAAGVHAQELSVTLQGTVINEYGEAVAGALLASENGKNQYLTDSDGAYSLPVTDGSRFVTVSAQTCQNLRISLADAVNGSEIKLKFDPHHTGGYVNTGYFTQSRESVTGAISTVTGAELDRAPVNILSESMAGRLAGLAVLQNLAEFTFSGYNNTDFMIRGITTTNGYEPMIIIDGIICPNQYYEFLTPKEIESISIVKDGSTALYGLQGSGGVIAITTKRGFIGKKKVNAYFDQSIQQMTKRPLFVSSGDYAELRNQAGVNDGLAPFSQFSQDEIDGFRSGADLLYPNNDWYSMFVRDFTLRQRAGVNVAGGSEKIRFFSNIGYLHQEEPFKIADEPDRKYDPTPVVHAANFRSNLDVKFNDYMSAYMRLTGNVTWERNARDALNRHIYSDLFSLPPTMYGPVSPVFEDDPDASNQVTTIDQVGLPVYGTLNRSGYMQTFETNVIAQAGLKADLSFLTQGLSVGGSMAYQTYSRNHTLTTQNYERWIRTPDYSDLQFIKKGSDENTPLVYSKRSIFFYHLNLLGTVDYKRRFGHHSIDAMGYIFYQKQEKEDASGAGILPYKRQSMGVTALYGYRDRYFVKGDLGYSGSEQFHPDHRYIATPAVSAAWIVSKEDFLAAVDPLSLLKLRASYGVSANDQLDGTRFLYLDNIDSNGNEGLKGNPEVSAEKIKKQNYGVDLGIFREFTVSFDYYVQKADNLLVGSTAKIPGYQGVPLGNYPKLNNGKIENRGFELEAGYDRRITKDLSVYAVFSFSQSKDKVISVNEAAYSEDYPYRYHTEGYPVAQQWGYLINKSNGNGYYNSTEELSQSGLNYSSLGTPRVGDFIYYDLNNDGVIDAKDMVPMGYPSIPQQYYAFSGGLSYRNLEFNFLFQGVNRTSFFISGTGVYENSSQGVFTDIHLNAWTPERYAAGEAIDYPALSLVSSTNHTNNSYFLMNGAYLRLKNVEIAYSLPVSISKKIAAERIRFSLTAQNLFTLDRMRTKYIDPEIRSMNTFQPFRVYNIGVNLTF
ncbi:MAG: SusC/RagA family TonB-linked outer membrane protein [Bacteroidales bacterium]|nr:SusC/RagA family TonB-linked outer membrane protein [Bacteroidales bacterium]